MGEESRPALVACHVGNLAKTKLKGISLEAPQTVV